MTNGQRIAVDLGSGAGAVLTVRDLGDGRFAADRVTSEATVTLTVDPTDPTNHKWSTERAGEWQQFTVHGGEYGAICFSSGNDKGIARLFGFVTLP